MTPDLQSTRWRAPLLRLLRRSAVDPAFRQTCLRFPQRAFAEVDPELAATEEVRSLRFFEAGETRVSPPATPGEAWKWVPLPAPATPEVMRTLSDSLVLWCGSTSGPPNAVPPGEKPPGEEDEEEEHGEEVEEEKEKKEEEKREQHGVRR